MTKRSVNFTGRKPMRASHVLSLMEWVGMSSAEIRRAITPAATVTTRYALVNIPGTELCDRGCEFCTITHPIQKCPAIRAELMKEDAK